MIVKKAEPDVTMVTPARLVEGCRDRLFADAELFLSDDGAVTIDVFAHQVVEQATTLTNKHLQRASGGMIFVI